MITEASYGKRIFFISLNISEGLRIVIITTFKLDLLQLQIIVIKNKKSKLRVLICIDTFFLKIFQILHIDGAQSRVPTHPMYNKGNVKYELQLFYNSYIKSLRVYQKLVEPEFELPTIQLMDVVHYLSKKISE